MNWLRLYNRTPHSPTLRRVAHDAGTTVANALAVWTYMLCHASGNEAEDRGSLNGWDDAECALTLGIDRAIVGSLRKAMVMRLIDDGGRIMSWDKHQSSSDNSTARWRKWNERRKENQTLNSEPTLDQRAANVGPTSKRREEEKRDTEVAKATSRSSAAPRPMAGVLEGFDEFWKHYPRKVGKGQARKAWPRAVKAAGSVEEIIAAVSMSEWDMREDGRFVPHPATWLNGERWLDGIGPDPEPAFKPKANGGHAWT